MTPGAVTADLGDNSAVGDDGRRWYGGPTNGVIQIAALPVRFSGEPVSAVTVNFCFEDITDSEAPYEFAFDCEGVEAGVGTPLISTGGTSGDILNIDDLPFPAFIDFVGPARPPVIAANPNGREDGWINAAVSLTAARRRDTDDAWMVAPRDRGDGGGVGGYNMMVRFGRGPEGCGGRSRLVEAAGRKPGRGSLLRGRLGCRPPRKRVAAS